MRLHPCVRRLTKIAIACSVWVAIFGMLFAGHALAGRAPAVHNPESATKAGQGISPRQPLAVSDTPTPTPSASPTPSPTATPTPTPTPTWTPTPTPTPVPPNCVDALLNSGFESEGAWVFSPTRLRPAYQGPAGYPPPAEGARVVRLGTRDQGNVLSYSSVRQYFELPTSAWYATLTFQVWPFTRDVDTDRQEAVLLDEFGRVHALLWRHHPPVDRPQWETVTVDLTPFIGGRYFLYFNAFNDGDGLPTALFLDAVHVWVCFFPTPPPSPTAQSTPSPTAASLPVTFTPTPTPSPLLSPTPTSSPSPTPPTDKADNKAIPATQWFLPLLRHWWETRQQMAGAFLRATCGLTLLIVLFALGIVKWLGVRQENPYP